MLDFNFYPSSRIHPPQRLRSCRTGSGTNGETALEARVKPDCVNLYPGVDPKTWYKVVQEGEYRDDLEGLWIQVSDWVTYVLARHFDVQPRTGMH